MDQKLKDLFTNAEFNPPAEEWRIRDIEEDLGFKLPYDYKEFLRFSSGVKGRIGNNDIDLWPANMIVKLNLDYSTQFDNVVYFGTNAGNGTIYAFWYRSGIHVIKIPMKSRSLAESEVIAESFSEFLEKLSKEEEHHQYEFQEKRISFSRYRFIEKEKISIDIDNTNIYINQQEQWNKDIYSPVQKRREESTVVPIEKISSIEIKYRYGIFHLLGVIIVVFILLCMSASDNHYRYNSIDKDLFFIALDFSCFAVLLDMLLGGYILNKFPDKRIRIKKNDGTSVKIPIYTRRKSETKKDIKKILENVKEINPDINIKDTSILEMIIILLISVSMIVISFLNFNSFFQY